MENHYIDQVLHGDTKSFKYFIQKYKDLVFAITYRVVKNEQDAEELTQDAFLKAFQNLHTFDRRSKFSTWLYRIALNVALNKNRQPKRFSASYEETDEVYFVDETESIMQKMKADEQKIYINKALNLLSDEESILLTLYYLAENNINEISQVMAISESNVKVRLFRARKNLYSVLQKLLKSEVNSLY